MRIAKSAVAAMAAAALAASMVCAAPAAMAAQSAPAANEAGSTYTTMAKAQKVEIEVGQKAQLPKKGVKKWTTSKKSVVSVSKKGVITGKKAGKATVTAKLNKGSVKYTVTVVDPVPAGDPTENLQLLAEFVKSNGIPTETEYYTTKYALPLDEAGDVGIVYEEDNDGSGSFSITDATDDNISSSRALIFESEPSKIANFGIEMGGRNYEGVISPVAGYKAGSVITWRDVTSDNYKEWTSVEGTDAEILTEIAEDSIYNIMGPAAAQKGAQLNLLGFYSLPDFK